MVVQQHKKARAVEGKKSQITGTSTFTCPGAIRDPKNRDKWSNVVKK